MDHKKYKKLLFVTLAILLTLSLIVYFQLILFYLIRTLYKINFKSISKLVLFFALSILSFLFLQEYWIENWLVSKASSAFQYLFSFGMEGNNNRAVDFNRLFIEQNQNEDNIIIDAYSKRREQLFELIN
jgi:hypothetical protein